MAESNLFMNKTILIFISVDTNILSEIHSTKLERILKQIMKDLFKMLVELFRFPFQWDFWNILHLKHCLKTETEVSLPGKLGESI